MSYDFDLFVIGGGSGGVRAARLAGERGLKVAMAEGDRMGGTCVIRGCVPKKLMLFASDFSGAFEHGRGYGWDVAEANFNWSYFQEKLQKELSRLEGIYENLMHNNNVRLFHAYATLEDAHHIILDNGTRFSAERILIATGGRPVVPEFDGNEHVLVSDDVFHMRERPEHLVVLGGGYIANEFANIFQGLGSKVTLIYRGEMILRGYDREICERIAEDMQARGIDIRFESNIASVEIEGEKKRVTLENGETILADEVLAATGRTPNLEELDLETAGVEFDEKGIKVNALSQTNIPNIYAIGDVTGRAALTPVAIREAVNFIETVYEGKPSSVNYDLIPTAVFTRPEFGTIGLSEDEARARGLDILVYFTDFRSMLSAFAEQNDRNVFKVVVDAKSDQVLGVHILGFGAAEMIQLVAIAVSMGATKAQLDATIAVHPTAAEELVTLKTPREA